MSKDNIWYYGVVDTEQLNTTIPCLVSKDEMQNWCTDDPKSTNCTLLNNITCENGKGLDCYDDPEAKYIFGPVPGPKQKASIPFKDSKGNSIKPDSSGYCKYPDPSFSSTPINIGPPDSSGNCTRNIFYCNGHGTCIDGACECDPKYNNKGDAANMCVLADECPFDPSINKYGCATSITFSKPYKTGECTGSDCVCYNPNGDVNTSAGAWEKVDGNAGYKQIGVDVTSATATKNIPKCSICALDWNNNGIYYAYKHFPGLNKETCSNGENFGCCSGTCMEVDGKDGKGLICGECLCDKDCGKGTGKYCKTSVVNGVGENKCHKSSCSRAGKATIFNSANCCHGSGLFTCPDNQYCGTF